MYHLYLFLYLHLYFLFVTFILCRYIIFKIWQYMFSLILCFFTFFVDSLIFNFIFSLNKKNILYNILKNLRQI